MIVRVRATLVEGMSDTHWSRVDNVPAQSEVTNYQCCNASFTLVVSWIHKHAHCCAIYMTTTVWYAHWRVMMWELLYNTSTILSLYFSPSEEIIINIPSQAKKILRVWNASFWSLNLYYHIDSCTDRLVHIFSWLLSGLVLCEILGGLVLDCFLFYTII